MLAYHFVIIFGMLVFYLKLTKGVRMKRHNFPGNKKFRQESAQLRQEKRAALTPQQQLKQLDDLFGVGLGAQRERVRLSKT